MSTTKQPWDLIHHLKSGMISGSPESTYGKIKHDGRIEDRGAFTVRSRQELNYHLLNGTDINSILNSMVSGIIGSKVNFQSRNPNKFINTSFEAFLKFQGKVENFMTTGDTHNHEAWRQIIRYEFLQGGVIIRYHTNMAWAVPTRLELISVDMIDASVTRVQDRVKNGIKKDVYNRVVGIYLFDEDKFTSTLYSMDDMVYYSSRWASLSQFTAISRLVSILPTLDLKTQYEDAEVRSALNSAKNGVYWKTELFSILKEAIDTEFRNVNATPSEKVREARELLERMASRGVGIDGATFIPAGDDIVDTQSKVDSQYTAIMDKSQMNIASSVGGSQISINKDVTKGNYASIKAAISFDEEFYKIEFDNVSNQVLENYLERMFSLAVLTGQIYKSKSSKLTINEYFLNKESYHIWDIMRTSRRVVDEQKDANSTAKKLETNQITPNMVYQRDGRDYIEEQLEQVKLDIDLAEQTKLLWDKSKVDNPNDEKEIEK